MVNIIFAKRQRVCILILAFSNLTQLLACPWTLISSSCAAVFFFCPISLISDMFLSVIITHSMKFTINCENMLMRYEIFALFSAAFLAPGYRYCPWVSSFFRRSVDGEELGHGGPTSQGPGWAVSQIHRFRTTEQHTVQTIAFHLYIMSDIMRNTLEFMMQLQYFLFPHYLPHFLTTQLFVNSVKWCTFQKEKVIPPVSQTCSENNTIHTMSMIFGFRRTKIIFLNIYKINGWLWKCWKYSAIIHQYACGSPHQQHLPSWDN